MDLDSFILVNFVVLTLVTSRREVIDFKKIGLDIPGLEHQRSSLSWPYVFHIVYFINLIVTVALK